MRRSRRRLDGALSSSLLGEGSRLGCGEGGVVAASQRGVCLATRSRDLEVHAAHPDRRLVNEHFWNAQQMPVGRELATFSATRQVNDGARRHAAELCLQVGDGETKFSATPTES